MKDILQGGPQRATPVKRPKEAFGKSCTEVHHAAGQGSNDPLSQPLIDEGCPQRGQPESGALEEFLGKAGGGGLRAEKGQEGGVLGGKKKSPRKVDDEGHVELSKRRGGFEPREEQGQRKGESSFP